MTARPTRPPMLAADHIRELIDHVTTRETIGRRLPVPTTLGASHDDAWTTDGSTIAHVVHHPALLDQIEQTITGRTVAQETYAAAYGSKPAGRIDCLDLLRRVDVQSKELAEQLGLPLLPVRDRLARISGAIGHDEHPRVRAWWLTARVLTQHDGPPFAPNVPCPVEHCDRRGTLRVRPDQHIAVCVECHTTWMEDTPHNWQRYGRLTSWIMWAAEHLEGPRHWVTDDEGELKECTACLAERDAMTERAVARAQRQRGEGEPGRHADAS